MKLKSVLVYGSFLLAGAAYADLVTPGTTVFNSYDGAEACKIYAALNVAETAEQGSATRRIKNFQSDSKTLKLECTADVSRRSPLQNCECNLVARELTADAAK